MALTIAPQCTVWSIPISNLLLFFLDLISKMHDLTWVWPGREHITCFLIMLDC